MALFDFVKKIIKKKSIELFNYGKHSRDFTYIDDVVDAVKKSTTFKLPNKNNKFIVFNIGYGKSIKLITFLKTIEKFLNKKS